MRKCVGRALAMGALALAMVAGTSGNALAVPFTITSNLTGDFRTNNPDNLLVHVTITGDTTSNLTQWIVDLDSPVAHPDMKLGVFAFNVLGGSFNDFTFRNVSPSSWTFASANNVPGSGGADFLLEANDPPGNGNNVTNAVPLMFTLEYELGNWDPSMLLNAPLSTGGGIPNPGAQLGAHLQSLSTAGCSGCSNSGFASGNYGGPPPTTAVPEPTSLLLMGIGLGATVLTRRRS